MSDVQTVEGRLAALEQRVESFAGEHAEFRVSHNSRRGVEGRPGPRGETGATGPSADPKQVAEIAAEIVKKAFRYETQIAKCESLLKEFEAEIIAVKTALRWAVIEELKASGVIDAEGHAVSGPAGKDSQVSGPKGDKGDTVTGPSGSNGRNGRDAKIAVGSVTSGDKVFVTLRDVDGFQVLDFILPRGERGADSTVPGPKGDSGERGEIGFGVPGLPAPPVDKNMVLNLIMDLKKRGAI
jgi:hypothetical protein